MPRRFPRAALFAPVFLATLWGAAIGAAEDSAGVIRSAIGVTRKGTPIPSLIMAGDLDHQSKRTRLLLIGGSAESAAVVRKAFASFAADKAFAGQRERYSLSVVPTINPDGALAGSDPQNSSGGSPYRGYPPPGSAYNSQTDPEAAYLWRWIGMHAPDLVVEVRSGEKLAWHLPAELLHRDQLAAELTPAYQLAEPDGLAAALNRHAPANVGSVPALQARVPADQGSAFLSALISALEKTRFPTPSPARAELKKRLDRTPRQVAEQLAKVYGHDLGSVVYIPSVAAIARLRLGKLIDQPEHVRGVEELATPYLNGQKPLQPGSPVGMAGHLIFCELAEQGNPQLRKEYDRLVRASAETAFDGAGRVDLKRLASTQMSDAVFMHGPLLARAGRLLREQRYHDACVDHLLNMQKLDMRADGLYRHSPLDEAAWGRGNGFPALGIAMVLSDLPKEHRGRADVLAMHRRQLTALRKHQDPTGCWRQVIDRPESYRELTSTSMITFAMIRGVRRGWLPREEYEPHIRQAWVALRTRIADGGELVDVCTGTGKQKTLRDYYDRTAILGRDGRGGAMALLVAVELADWERESAP